MKHRHSIMQKVVESNTLVAWLRGAAPCVSPAEIRASLHRASTDTLAQRRFVHLNVVLPKLSTENHSFPQKMCSP